MIRPENARLVGNASYGTYPTFLVSTLISGLRTRVTPAIDGDPDSMFSIICDATQEREAALQSAIASGLKFSVPLMLRELYGVPEAEAFSYAKLPFYCVGNFDVAADVPGLPKVAGIDWRAVFEYARSFREGAKLPPLERTSPWHAEKLPPVFEEDYENVGAFPKGYYDICVASSLFSGYSARFTMSPSGRIEVAGAASQPLQREAFFETVAFVESEVARCLSGLGLSQSESGLLLSKVGLDAPSVLPGGAPDPLPIDWEGASRFALRHARAEEMDGPALA